MGSRKLILHAPSSSVRPEELARLIAYHVTGGDPAGYLARLAEKEAAEKSAGEGLPAASGYDKELYCADGGKSP